MPVAVLEVVTLLLLKKKSLESRLRQGSSILLFSPMADGLISSPSLTKSASYFSTANAMSGHTTDLDSKSTSAYQLSYGSLYDGFQDEERRPLILVQI